MNEIEYGNALRNNLIEDDDNDDDEIYKEIDDRFVK